MSGKPVRTVALLAMLVTGASGLSVAQEARSEASEQPYPTPSVYPISWQFEFEHSEPKRVVIEAPGQPNPEAYWYITYRITNNTDQERIFLPVFELMTEDGRLSRSDRNIPPGVFETIKGRERNEFLQTQAQIGGQLRLGEDQAKDGVAIWKEPMPEMGQFTIFVSGLSGESATTKIGDQEFRLRKTLKLDYLVRGDEIQPHRDVVTPQGEEWIMR